MGRNYVFCFSSHTSFNPRSHLKVDDQQANDPFVISNNLNTFFTTIGKKIESKIVQTDKKYSDFLDNPLLKTFFLIPTEPNEVQSLIKTLNLKKAKRPNSIPTKLLKAFAKIISVPLANYLLKKEFFQNL